MCGRFTLSHTIQEVLKEFEPAEDDTQLAPSYNIAPTQMIPVVYQMEQTRLISNMRWGLVPFWMKTLPKGSPMINARAETVAEKPAFRAAFKYRRCLIPADGFYEWRTTGNGK